MSKTKHTPGPWTIETPMGDDNPWIVEAGKQSYEWHCLAIVPMEVEDDDDLPITEAKANARLMVAAPDFEDAAQCYVRWVEVFKEHQIAPNVLNAMENAFGAKLRAAIRKATGAALKTA